MNLSIVSAVARPATTTASAVSSKARSTSTFPTSSVLRSATMNVSLATLRSSRTTFTPYFLSRGVPTSSMILSLSGSSAMIFLAPSRLGLSRAIWRYGGLHSRGTLKPIIGCLALSLSYRILSSDGYLSRARVSASFVAP